MACDDKRIHRHDFLPAWDPPGDHTDLKKVVGMTSTHVSHLGKGRIVARLGRVPDDLVDVLAELAVAGLAVTAREPSPA